jgi:hypothetical protein
MLVRRDAADHAGKEPSKDVRLDPTKDGQLAIEIGPSRQEGKSYGEIRRKSQQLKSESNVRSASKLGTPYQAIPTG